MRIPFTKNTYFREHIHPLFAKIPVYESYLLKKKSYLKDTGWFKSFRQGQSVDAAGKPIPWFTYGAIELLKERLPKGVNVFEYGCGLGTLWWGERAECVYAVEHVEAWFNKMKPKLHENVDLKKTPLDPSYEKAIELSGKEFDIIIIDGQRRMECAAVAIRHLAEGGIVIYDDTDRVKSKEAKPFFKNNGFRHLSFIGFSPIEFMKCETTIFYKPDNILNL